MELLKLPWNEVVINQFPGFFGIVSVESKILLVNDTGSKWTGFKSADAMIGLSYEDMHCKVAEAADYCIELDKKAVNHNRVKYLGYFCYAKEEWKIIFGEKYLLTNTSKEPIGIAIYFNDFTDSYLFDLGRFLLNSSQKHLQNKIKKQFGYTIEDGYLNACLTKRQSECLFFLLRGKSIKEIGRILNLSPRTVESHIEQIKNKLDCFTKANLIEKAISLGYMNVIPDSLLEKLHSGLN